MYVIRLKVGSFFIHEETIRKIEKNHNKLPI